MDYQKQWEPFNYAVKMSGIGNIKVGPRLATFAFDCLEITKDHHEGQLLLEATINAYRQERRMDEREFEQLTWKAYPDWKQDPKESDTEE